MTQVSLSFLYGVLRSTLAVYIALVALHFVLEVFFAHRAYRRSKQGFPDPARLPSVDVVVPCYNEDAEHLTACFDALLDQDYEGELHVYVVDDGSPNRDQVRHVYDQYGALDGWHVLLPAANRGKRHAQDAALAHCRSDIVVTIDSDTEIAADGVTQIVRPFVDARIGAVTGDVAVTNRSANILTRLIGMRYWVAFNQERAAQSYFRSVLCCSGPFSAYRRSDLMAIWPAYISQTFKGTPCTYGDDRHLTNLILAKGSQTLFLPQARARTNAPETIRGYLKQQLRWNKSFYREVLWTLPFLSRLGAYIAFEMSVQVLLPLLLTVLILSSTLVAILLHPAVGLRYVAVTAMMGLLRCSYAIYRTRDPRFVMFLLYGFIHVFLLIPVRIRALLTLTDNRWGTRTAVASSPAHDELADRLADAV